MAVSQPGECTAVKLGFDAALARLAANDHGVLCTMHTERGIDAVPVVYAVSDDGYVGVPIDRVKPKAAVNTQLQRERNLDGDPRATLLIERWDHDDWSDLWWVRAELRWDRDAVDRSAELSAKLAAQYEQYRDEPFDRIIVFKVVSAAGWAARAD